MRLTLIFPIVFIAIQYIAISESSSTVSYLIKFGMLVLKNSKYFGQDKKFSIEHSILDVSAKIDGIEKALKSSAESTVKEINRLIQYNQIMNQFVQNLNYIDRLYDQFEKYFTSQNYEQKTLKDFAWSSTSHANNELRSVMDTIHRSIVPNTLATNGLFDALIENRRTKTEAALLCNRTASLQQEIYNLYNIAGLSFVKGYTMVRFSYEILKDLNQGNFTQEINDLQKEFSDLVVDIGLRVNSIMIIVSRDIRTCDPSIHEESETYEQLIKFIQGFVVNKACLNRDHSCAKSCGSYKETEFYSYPGLPSEGDYKCQGKLYNCFNENGLGYCPPHNNPNGDRRYGGFTAVKVLLGKNVPDKGDVSNCPTVPKYLSHIWGNVRSGYLTTCSICACYCDDYENSQSVRTFSLREVESNIAENMVVTGIRLKKVNRVFHIQIQQGKLEPDGKINDESVHWVPVNDFDPSNPEVSTSDYHVMNYHQRSINLDTLSAPAGYVMTGIKFSESDGRLFLSIKTVPFNFTEGLLIQNNLKNEWMSNSEIHNSEIELTIPHIPTLAPNENVVDVEDNRFVTFGWTDYVKDLSQTPVPFLDIQPVVTDPPTVLSGAGIIFKGQTGFGGFVSLKLVSYDYSEFVTTDFTNME